MIRTSAFCFLVVSTNVFADPSIEFLREKIVSKYNEKQQEQIRLVEQYIKDTGDLKPTRAKIQDKYFRSSDLWTNFRKEECSKTSNKCRDNLTGGVQLIFDKNTRKIILKNTLGTNPNSSIKKYYKDLNNSYKVKIDNSNNVTYRVDLQTLRIIRLSERINANPKNYLGVVAPSTSKNWYKINSRGGADIKKYKNGKWVKIGYTNSSTQRGKVFVESEGELKTVPCEIGDVGYVQYSQIASEFTCNNENNWVNLNI